jgi:hypothetical protein
MLLGLNPEDGASELLRNVGNYRSTWCHISEDWNLPRRLALHKIAACKVSVLEVCPL